MRIKLTYEIIKNLAIKAGKEYWKDFYYKNESPILDECINFNVAWMFFRNTNINIPDHYGLKKCAIVISDMGEIRYTADFYPDMNECRSYLIKMSEYFEKKNI